MALQPLPHMQQVLQRLCFDKNPHLLPDDIFNAMEGTAIDMLSPGFDYDSGYGLLQAVTRGH
ncbi:MAG TPA: hypothetical protein VJL89_07435 [Thermodesulfovibrionia bacterium]|nr:hypothetical protein [Thermodesulfovibrionia bacterium]